MYKAFFISAAAKALAAPTSVYPNTREPAPFQQNLVAWDEGAIAAGLNETILLTEHAKEHVLRWGNSSELYQKYFGKLPPYEVVGSLDMIINGDKGGVLFRCDNPDGNCEQEGWVGHWRGANATDETVICDLSYQTRRWLNSICGLGYTVADGATNTFWASDLMHRLYHMPAIGYGYIEHYIETYNDALSFAQNGTTTNTHDSDVLQYFALDTYAYDVAAPGVGCTAESSTHEASAPATTSSVTASVSQAASQTSSAPAECHTHDDGIVHCS